MNKNDLYQLRHLLYEFIETYQKKHAGFFEIIYENYSDVLDDIDYEIENYDYEDYEDEK